MAKMLDAKNVVVNGGTGALGSAVVSRLLEEGAVCHVPHHGDAEPQGFAFAGQDRVCLALGVDLADAAAVDGFYADLPDLWASIHLAGGFASAKIQEADPSIFRRMMDMNAQTAFLCCRAAARAMLVGGKGGRIVNVAARPALEPRRGAGMVAYVASKAAVAAMTVALAEELKGADILVNAIAPSTLDTPANRAGMPKADPSKWVSLEAAAETILFLVSPRNTVTSGAVLPLYAKA